MQFLHLICADYSLKGAGKQALTEFGLLTVIGKER